MNEQFPLLTQLWRAGVASVSGRRSVGAALDRDGPFAASLVVAAGKAACSMFLGARPSLTSSTPSIIATKYGHVDPACRAAPRVEIFEAGHPVPDERSIAAGEAILRAVAGADAEDRLLLLLSGGASAIVEALQPGHTLNELQALTRRLLGSGETIAEMNAARSRLSRLKGGRLLEAFRGREARVYAVSDVRGDDLAVIGGGIGDPRRVRGKVAARIVASNRDARDAAAREAERLGFALRLNEESLYGDVTTVAAAIAERLVHGPAGVYIWGGEPTIELPPHPGTGGRNQSLALAIAVHLRGRRGVSVLVAGTDGTDGPTDYAGAYVDGETVGDPEETARALQAADAGRYLGARGRLFRSGPTDTNVMDLVVATVVSK